MDTASSGRDGKGRFAPGNAGGPGRRLGSRNPLRQAAAEAVAPDHIAAIMRRATRMALEGNLTAMKFVVERTCGRAAEVPAEANPIDIALPQLRTAANCTAAIDRLAEAICQGTVDRDAAKVLLEVIQTRLKAIEVNDLEARLTELESAANAVAGKRL